MKKKKIIIIGAGIYGCSIYLKLVQKYDCIIFEKSNDFLNGATGNNLNRIHYGYHYPRDQKTAELCMKGYNSFKKIYSKSIISNFANYYSISGEGSKTNSSSYLKFLIKNKLFYKKVFLNFANNKLLDIYKVNEPLYDIKILRKILKKKIPKKNIIFNQQVIKVVKKQNNIFEIQTFNKKKYEADIIIDASHYSTNSILKKNKKKIKKNYQLTCVYEIKLKSNSNFGFAIMDGNYFSILPHGKNKTKHLLYDVEHSILKQKICYELPKNYLDFKNYKKKINQKKIYINKKIKKYLPNLKYEFTGKTFLALRVFLPSWKKKDSRVPKLFEHKKNYFQVLSTKVDHAVLISNILNKIIAKKKTNLKI